MKRLKIVGILFGLLVLSLALAQSASADPISPPSAGCQASNISVHISGSAYMHGPDYFYDDDEIHMQTSTPVNFQITGGINKTISHATEVYLNIPHSTFNTIKITSLNGGPFNLALSCTSTPISGGCIVTNNFFQDGIGFHDLPYNAGESLHVVSTPSVSVTITGAATGSVANTTNLTILFPRTGYYTVIIQSATVRQAKGEVTCTLPR